ncbi:ATPase family AAA domain-containing protein At1g05910 isoform X2 [Amaranthus tricolor]|uniref:ATPase family AAA domain-containing protein At1g05910 isoform X2 n=1 Tax=Amaranthus tricolor TaxID=29722 RepID=UPI0025860ACC|nr:ATPase family AAA domain-containing protein At1g05910 isoform X2 [Amaranthus tricolor]
MHSKRSSQRNENGNLGSIGNTLNNNSNNTDNDGMVTRTSNRIRRPALRGLLYYSSSSNFLKKRKKSKTRTAAVHIAKLLKPGARRPIGSSKKSISNDMTNLRRSTRQRRVSVNLDDYTDSSGSDADLMKPGRYRTRSRMDNSAARDELSPPKRRKVIETKSTPRREGLRPRNSKSNGRRTLAFDDEEGSSDEKDEQDELENGNDGEDHEEEGEGDDEGEAEEGGEGEEEDEREDEREEDGDDEEGEEGQGGRRRYDLRNRADVRRLSMVEGKLRPRSPRRVLHHGMGNKVNRVVGRGGTRVHKRHRFTRIDDSDDSLLVDELDQGPAIPWARSGSRSGAPWLLGGLDMHGATAWGLNVAASGWGHQTDSHTSLTTGVQTAGPSSKGGADIQPLQVDENVSFDDIGGLSDYIDALKEMVFFPLLYPDFFASYNITPPRGVLLCGPPGTGKTLIARALACAASKAGQKVSFYMRKGADVLSKWVGEAERQLKLLFEEAQKNQPSIIFFDEIDGLAPVRSSKQEQIHNSIVSTLLALMDGLDSRGQVVLIGATNRIDAIDGALRRPGRFDREFNFPLPGCEARAEIIHIHTRKWKHPPSSELKTELAASCVGYCGADLKALCTEAAIRAFREKYPQVYTSDDKFVIDVDSVRVEKFHFFDAMSTITPAAHRGSIVHSRPLSAIVAPCLQRHLQKAMAHISDIFPASAISSEMTKLSMLSYGSAIPLVYRPRFLLYGNEGVGLDHLGPAILHELEKFPVHSLGLPSLLSDPSAKTPEEALVHIFGEARRTTPSILYIPHYDLWWENAHDQLRAVLLTLLEDLPSESPILLLGTTSDLPADMEGRHRLFSERSIYKVDGPSNDDRSLFFDQLIEASLSVLSETTFSKLQTSTSVPELPKAPKVVGGPKISELKAKVEEEQHALRRMRMCLRDVCNRILYDKRFSAFHYPVTDEDAPNYRSIIQNPMDVVTLLQRVDSGQYITSSAFQQDVDLILSNAKAYNGDDYNGARIVSRAHELRDAVEGMLSQMDPALVAYCDKIAAQGGPSQMPEGYGDSALVQTPVVQTLAVTRASARLRNVQPEVNLGQTYEVLKKPKKNVESISTAIAAEDKSKPQESLDPPSTEEAQVNSGPESPTANCSEHEAPTHVEELERRRCPEDVDMDDNVDTSGLKQRFLKCTEGYGIPQLERLYTRILKGVFEAKSAAGSDNPKSKVLQFLTNFPQDDTNF